MALVERLVNVQRTWKLQMSGVGCVANPRGGSDWVKSKTTPMEHACRHHAVTHCCLRASACAAGRELLVHVQTELRVRQKGTLFSASFIAKRSICNEFYNPDASNRVWILALQHLYVYKTPPPLTLLVRHSVVGTGSTVRGSNPGRGEISRTRPDRPWVPSGLLYSVAFSGIKQPGHGANHPHPHPSSAQGKETIKRYFCSFSCRVYCIRQKSYFARVKIPEN